MSGTALPAPARRQRGPRVGLGNWVVIIICTLFFMVPLIVTGVFSLWEGGHKYGISSYSLLIHSSGFWRSLLLSLQLAVETILLSFVLLVPAMIFVHLKAPRLKPVFEVIATLPFVIPAIALIAGLSTLYTGPNWLIGTPNYLVIPYFFLALPYGYRSIDVGLNTLDVKTLTEAGQSLGAGWGRIILFILVPNLTAALVGATLLTLTIVMGEFTFASVLLFKTFAVFINDTGQNEVTEAAALSLFSFVLTWAAMLGVIVAGKRQRTRIGAR
jgi:putative spermidine/putrescine transport system permease protein